MIVLYSTCLNIMRSGFTNVDFSKGISRISDKFSMAERQMHKINREYKYLNND